MSSVPKKTVTLQTVEEVKMKHHTGDSRHVMIENCDNYTTNW
jgi:hypothetical protein